MSEGGEQEMLRSVALQNAQSILAARLRAEQALLEATRDLEESRQLLQAALSAADAGAFKWQPGDDRFDLDDNAGALLGLATPASPIPLEALGALVAEPDRQRFIAHFTAAASSGRELDTEFRLQAPAPWPTWLEARGRPLRDAGSGSCFVGTFTNVSNRKRSEEALRESSELLRGTFNKAGIGMAIARLDGVLEVVNEKFVEILGYPRERLGQMNFRDFCHPDDAELTERNVRRLLEGDIDEYAMEKRYIRVDGTSVWSHTTVSLLRDAEGKPHRFIGAINDITARKQAEQALQEETRVLDLLNQANAALVSQLDLKSLVQSVTDMATQLSGAKLGAFFHNSTDENGQTLLLHSLSGAPRMAFEHFPDPRATAIFGPTFRGEAIVRSDDILADPRYGQSSPYFGMPAGHPAVRSYLAVPVKSRDGAMIGGLFFGHPEPGVFTERDERVVSGIAAQAAIAIENARLYEDVSRASAEREHLLQAERAARSLAERAGLMKDEFLSTLSHELRTPLNAVLGWAQILLNKNTDPQTLLRGAEVIARNAQLQAKLIDDLLDMNRIVSGKVKLDLQPIWLDSVLESALDAIRPTAQAREITLRKIIEVPLAPVSGDPVRLQQVVWNLLTNAIKFSEQGGTVTVRVARVKSHLELSVADEGIGISAEFLPFVFDRFRQADSSTTRAVGGLGLGLAIVKQLVELHGGQVQAMSEGAGKGCCMRIRLPVARAQDAAIARSQDEELPRSKPFAIDLSGVRALVVDDEVDAGEMVGIVLSRSNASVVTASSADQALGLLDAGRFDILVSDIGMPGKDGYQMMRELRRRPADRGGEIPAVALTAFARSEDRTRAMLCGYQVHLSKPVQPWELVATVGSLLGCIVDK